MRIQKKGRQKSRGERALLPFLFASAAGRERFFRRPMIGARTRTHMARRPSPPFSIAMETPPERVVKETRTFLPRPEWMRFIDAQRTGVYLPLDGVIVERICVVDTVEPRHPFNFWLLVDGEPLPLRSSQGVLRICDVVASMPAQRPQPFSGCAVHRLVRCRATAAADASAARPPQQPLLHWQPVLAPPSPSAPAAYLLPAASPAHPPRTPAALARGAAAATTFVLSLERDCRAMLAFTRRMDRVTLEGLRVRVHAWRRVGPEAACGGSGPGFAPPPLPAALGTRAQPRRRGDPHRPPDGPCCPSRSLSAARPQESTESSKPSPASPRLAPAERAGRCSPPSAPVPLSSPAT